MAMLNNQRVHLGKVCRHLFGPWFKLFVLCLKTQNCRFEQHDAKPWDFRLYLLLRRSRRIAATWTSKCRIASLAIVFPCPWRLISTLLHSSTNSVRTDEKSKSQSQSKKWWIWVFSIFRSYYWVAIFTHRIPAFKATCQYCPGARGPRRLENEGHGFEGAVRLLTLELHHEKKKKKKNYQ